MAGGGDGDFLPRAAEAVVVLLGCLELSSLSRSILSSVPEFKDEATGDRFGVTLTPACPAPRLVIGDTGRFLRLSTNGTAMKGCCDMTILLPRRLNLSADSL